MAISLRGTRRKGANAENEVRDFLRDQLGEHITRSRGEGANDHGDVTGTPNLANQVKAYADVARAVNDGLADVQVQKANAGCLWGAAWIRRRGGRYFVAMTAEDFVSMYREAVLAR